ncbi:TPA: hypothetical protein RQN76_004163 [Aeromonas dhakensis]|nr:hypothetical protein [Aeromonas dhakensis]
MITLYVIFFIFFVVWLYIAFNKRNVIVFEYVNARSSKFQVFLRDLALYVTHSIYKISLIKKVNDKLVSVGVDAKTARDFIITRTMLGFILASVLFGFMLDNVIASLSCSLFLSLIFVYFLSNKRVSDIKRQREDVSIMMLTILKMCIGSGSSIDNAVEVCAIRLHNIEKSASHFLELYNLQKNHIGYEKAAKIITDNWSCTAVHKVFETIPTFARDGGDLFHFIGSEIERFLEKKAHKTEEKVAKLSSKMTIPMIMLIMFPSFALMVGPAIAISIGIISGSSR